MFDLSVWRCSAEVKQLAERIAATEGRDATRVAEERKKRNYAGVHILVWKVAKYFRVCM